MGRIEPSLQARGLSLPEPLTPPGNFQPVRVHNGLAYIAGHGPFDGAQPLVQGLVGIDLSLEEGYDAARLTALSMFASLKRELGDLGPTAALAGAPRSSATAWEAKNQVDRLS